MSPKMPFLQMAASYASYSMALASLQIATEGLFQPSKQDLIGVVLADLCRNVGLEVAVCESKSDRVCSVCHQKIRNLLQL